MILSHGLLLEKITWVTICKLNREYGTTRAGLKALGYELGNDEFHANLHGRLMSTDPVLRIAPLSIPQRKIIFTNSDKVHAEEVLGRLGLEDCFEGVICFETLNPPVVPSNGLNKSQDCLFSVEPSAANPPLNQWRLQFGSQLYPKKTFLFDDSTRNIASGKAAGFHTVIFGRSAVV
ncbi:uncharacterized protein LOC100841294 [Brachypodium distachyon]|uniref:uncharacterized protein LOC100841294 n=1 Tax=Brachypodium distachyon TaxID=15368 RepID=UPI00052FEEFB|nr:uncharacterized protein LOC100841294 [Brachypodium distachyon]|eukprot:XP_024313174.1 uncharacterized protein LOC100841294 [Brachypodium distachyon]